jgi:NAD-dependent DNA ligase
MNFFTRQAAGYRNEINQSFASLVGIAQGIICDADISDGEIRFLNDWLTKNEAIAAQWPGDVIHARVKAILADGIITQEERQHLTQTLEQLIGGSLERLAESPHVTKLALDEGVQEIRFPESVFCLTGDFVYAPRSTCETAIKDRGGIVSGSVTKKLTYLVIGGMGSPEWKHGSFGTKIEKAMQYKRDGIPIIVVHEDIWASSL